MNRALRIASQLSNPEGSAEGRGVSYQSQLLRLQESQLRRGEAITERVDCWIHTRNFMGLLRFHPHFVGGASSSGSCVSLSPSPCPSSSSRGGGGGSCCWFPIPPTYQPVPLQEETDVHQQEEKPESSGCLSVSLRRALLRGLRTLEADPRCSYIVFTSCSPHLFSLGANTFYLADGVLESPTVEELCQAVLQCSKPTISAIMGKCYSWAWEMALCTTYRVAVGGQGRTLFSFPEAAMALIPGSLTGIQALVKRTGVPGALRVLCSGEVLSGTTAYQTYQLVDVLYCWWSGSEARGSGKKTSGGLANATSPMHMTSFTTSTTTTTRRREEQHTKKKDEEDQVEKRAEERRREIQQAVERVDQLFLVPPRVAAAMSSSSSSAPAGVCHPSPVHEELERWWEQWMDFVAQFAVEKCLCPAVSTTTAAGTPLPLRAPTAPGRAASTAVVARTREKGAVVKGGVSSSSSYPPFPDPITTSLLPWHPNAARSALASMQEWTQVRMCCAWVAHRILVLPTMSGQFKAPYCMVETIRQATIRFRLPSGAGASSAAAPARVAAAEAHWKRHRERFMKFLTTLPETKGVEHYYQCIRRIEGRVEAAAAAADEMKRFANVEQTNATPTPEEGHDQTKDRPADHPACTSVLCRPRFRIRQVGIVAEDVGRAAFLAAMILHYLPSVSVLVLCLRPTPTLTGSSSTSFLVPFPLRVAKEATGEGAFPTAPTPLALAGDGTTAPPAPKDGDEERREEKVGDEITEKPLQDGRYPGFSSSSSSSSSPPLLYTHDETFLRRESQKQFLRMKAFHSAVLDYLRLFQRVWSTENDEDEDEKGEASLLRSVSSSSTAGTPPSAKQRIGGVGPSVFPIGGHPWREKRTRATPSPALPDRRSLTGISVEALRQRVDRQLRLIDAIGAAGETMLLEEDGEPTPATAIHKEKQLQKKGRKWRWEGVPPSFYQSDLLLECSYPSSSGQLDAVPSWRSEHQRGRASVQATRQAQLFAYLDHAMAPSCIFLTTTAMTNVKALSMVVPRHADRVLGAFFPPRVQIHAGVVEINPPSTTTDPIVLATVLEFCLSLRSYPMLVRPPTCGSVTCRLFLTGLRQAQECVIAGCFPIEVDRAMRRRTKCRLGPLALEDMWGLDWCAAVRNAMRSSDRRVESALSRGFGHWARPPPSSFAASHTTPPLEKTDLPHYEQLAREIQQGGAQVGWRTGGGWFGYDPCRGREFFHRYGGAYGKEVVKRCWKACGLGLLMEDSTSPPSSFALSRLGVWFSLAGSGSADPERGKKKTPERYPSKQQHVRESGGLLEFPDIFELVPPLYVWDPYRSPPQHSRQPELVALQYCSRAGLFRRDVTEVEITERYCLAVVQEAVRLLSDGLVQSSRDIDLLSVYALDFPTWTGGVLFESQKMANPKSLLNKIRVYMYALGEEVFPPPCRAILEMAQSNTTIHDRFSGK